MINQNFVLLGVVIEFVGGLIYIIETLKGTIQPNKISWLLWSIYTLIAFAAEVSQGVGIVSLTTFITGFCPFLVFIASFFNKKSQWKITKFDIGCGLLSILGILLWYITKTGNFAILFSIIADTLAGLPTIIKSYNEPETENDFVFSFGIINAGIGLLVINVWNFQNYGFPLYLLLIQTLFFVLIRFKLGKKIKLSHKLS
ncbi:MAG TPA: hypothetical protein VMR41_03985 [Patescibacteria group bacterium]|nr:hypothetical protein [Patescibacteria group bacterium]